MAIRTGIAPLDLLATADEAPTIYAALEAIAEKEKGRG